MSQITDEQAVVIATLDKKVKVSSADTTTDYLDSKIVGGDGVTKSGTTSLTLASTHHLIAPTTSGSPVATNIVMLDNGATVTKCGRPASFGSSYKCRVLGVMVDSTRVVCEGFAQILFVETTPTIGAACYVATTAGYATTTARPYLNVKEHYLGIVVANVSANVAVVALNIRLNDIPNFWHPKRQAMQAIIPAGKVYTWNDFGASKLSGVTFQAGAPVGTYFDWANGMSDFTYEVDNTTGGPIDGYCTSLVARTTNTSPSFMYYPGGWDFPTAEPFTFLMWVRYDATRTGDHKLFTVCMSTETNWTTPYYVVTIDINGSGGSTYLGFSIKTSSGTYTAKGLTATYLPTGTWKLLGLTYDPTLGSNHLKACVNGVQIDQVSTAGTILTGTYGWIVGEPSAYSAAAPGRSSSFTVSDFVHVRNHAMTASDQLSMYNIGIA